MQVTPTFASVSNSAFGIPVEQIAALFPNPTQGPFTLRMSLDSNDFSGEFRVMDAMGSIVRTFTVSGPYSYFDLTGPAHGIYFVETCKNARFIQSFRVSYE